MRYTSPALLDHLKRPESKDISDDTESESSSDDGKSDDDNSEIGESTDSDDYGRLTPDLVICIAIIKYKNSWSYISKLFSMRFTFVTEYLFKNVLFEQ